MQSAERELELVVLYAVGDSTGPLVGEVSIGFSSRKALEDAIKAAQRWRSAVLDTHFAHIIRGNASMLRVKTALEISLRVEGRNCRGSWYRITGSEICERVEHIARIEHVKLMTEAEAIDLQNARTHETMSQMAARFGR